MKKTTAAILILSCAFASASASGDLYKADNARLEMQKAKKTEELFRALKKETSPRLKEGLIYSLGSLQYTEALPFIEKTAFAEKDGSPAAILALAMYPNTENKLRELADNGSKVAQSAMFIKRRATRGDNFRAIENSKDQTAAIGGLYNLDSSAESLEFLLKYEAQNDTTATAQCFALAKIGGTKAADKIWQIHKARKIEEIAFILARCKDSSRVIENGIREKDLSALKAAQIAAVSEAEDILLAQIFDGGSDETYRKEIFAALEAVGAKKTSLVLSGKYPSLNLEEIGKFYKILNSSLPRCDGDTLKTVYANLEKCLGTNDERKKTAERLLKK